MALERCGDQPAARHRSDDRAGASGRVHQGDGARGGGARRGAQARSSDRDCSRERTRARRRDRRRNALCRCDRHRHGSMVDRRVELAAASAHFWAEGPQPRVRHRQRGAGRGVVPRIPGAERRNAHAGNFSAHRRHDLHLRDLVRKPGACRSRRCHARPRRVGASGERLRQRYRRSFVQQKFSRAKPAIGRSRRMAFR